ncbi:MAG: tetratricopeptide repeat protein [Candidatus Eisenbacteria sp.]|nr:tetratricopeptide repeat protein [Candidatus Eisenbacteria bacterium]
MKQALLLCLTVMITIAIHGCAAPGLYQQGRAALDQDDYAEAVRLLEMETKENPEHWESHRDLGIALYKSSRYAEARRRLEIARAALPDDGATLFYLGATFEQLGEDAAAIEVYRHYTEVGSLPLFDTGFRRKMKQRINVLTRRQLREQVRGRIEEESRHAPSASAENTIAVVPFSVSRPTDVAAPLAAAVAHWLATDLAQIRHLQVVERLQLDVLLQELQLAEREGLVDPATAPRLGRLVGAGRIVGGSLLQLTEDHVRIDVSVTASGDGEVEVAEMAEGELDRFFEIEKHLVFALLEGLGIEPSPAERSSIEHVPTRNLRAILAYGRGLLAERRGEYGEAQLAYQAALDHDGSFHLAGQMLEAVPSGSTPDLGEIAATIDAEVGDLDPVASEPDRLEVIDQMTSGDIWSVEPEDARPWDQIGEIPEPPAPPDAGD